MRALAKKNPQWKENIFFAIKFAQQKLSKQYDEVTSTTGMLLISGKNLDPFWKLRLFRKLYKEIDIKPADNSSYTPQYQKAFLKYVENEYGAKLQCLLVTQPETIPDNNLVSFAMASRSGQYSYAADQCSSDDDMYWMRNNVAETTPGGLDLTACWLTAARLYSNSPSELLQNWGQINPYLKDYHSDPMEISCTFWIPDINNW